MDVISLFTISATIILIALLGYIVYTARKNNGEIGGDGVWIFIIGFLCIFCLAHSLPCFATAGLRTMIAGIALFVLFIYMAYSLSRKRTFDKAWVCIIGSVSVFWLAYSFPTFARQVQWPWQKDDMAKIDALIIEGAGYLDEDGNWTNKDRSREVYDQLKERTPAFVTNALVRQVLRGHSRLQVLFLAIKLGEPGSEEELATALVRHGNKQMAEDYLNSGSDYLQRGAEAWSRKHGYEVNTGRGSHRAYWGEY